jgi:hypothetical protein
MSHSISTRTAGWPSLVLAIWGWGGGLGRGTAPRTDWSMGVVADLAWLRRLVLDARVAAS